MGVQHFGWWGCGVQQFCKLLSQQSGQAKREKEVTGFAKT